MSSSQHPLFSIRWEHVGSFRDFSEIRVTLLNEDCSTESITRRYRNWIGVCTNHIEDVVQDIQDHFPGHSVTYIPFGEVKNILPYFEHRLSTGNLDYRSKPFYKVYTTASHQNVGQFFKRYQIGYFGESDWLVRIYIDFCTRFNSFEFYYKWYRVTHHSSQLLDSLEMIPDRTDAPDWTIAAFDLETVALQGDHLPMGLYATDRIVMISLFKWNRKRGLRQWLLYLLPDRMEPLPGYPHAYTSEVPMLYDFHHLLGDAQVITGYNIDHFDFPCLFARLLWLQHFDLLKFYSSFNIGQHLVTTFRNKLVLDLYSYVHNFSAYDLPSFKLDDVARAKLGGDSKVAVRSTGIGSWYRCAHLPKDVFESEDVSLCFRHLTPPCKMSEFGTFRTYLDYCLKDTELVYKLFEKEMTLSFLVARANFTSLNVMEALHFGNSRYLLELFKTYGTRLGYFVDAAQFSHQSFTNDYQFLFDKHQKYKGALNYCRPEKLYEDVSVLDFKSMYPSTLLSGNLCYGTCTVLTREAWLQCPTAQRLTSIAYRSHSDRDFHPESGTGEDTFSYPSFDPDRDEYAIVINRKADAFLPRIVHHFLQLRQSHQDAWKCTRDIYHYNVQLGTKILLNSLYGVMANKNSPLAYIPIAACITACSRYQLLGSYHFIQRKGYTVCYADTDSLMVERWPDDHCEAVNRYLNMPHVELKYEQRMKYLLVVSKKRYVYEDENGSLVTKGFQKKINDLIKFMSTYILERVWKVLVGAEESTPSDGWIIWMEVLLHAQYMCRDPQKYAIYRKIKSPDEYKSKACASFQYLLKYPDRVNQYVEYSYCRADVQCTGISKWLMDVKDCQTVNYEQLFINQKKIFCILLNIAYWKYPHTPMNVCNMVTHTILWRNYVHAELKHYFATRKEGGRRLLMLVEPKVRYPFWVNDHVSPTSKRGRKRKLNLHLEMTVSQLDELHRTREKYSELYFGTDVESDAESSLESDRE